MPKAMKSIEEQRAEKTVALKDVKEKVLVLVGRMTKLVKYLENDLSIERRVRVIFLLGRLGLSIKILSNQYDLILSQPIRSKKFLSGGIVTGINDADLYVKKEEHVINFENGSSIKTRVGVSGARALSLDWYKKFNFYTNGKGK